MKDFHIIQDVYNPSSVLDEKKLEILHRFYKFLSLEELEAMEAPLKDRVGYLDINY
jgi:hypothetical protein